MRKRGRTEELTLVFTLKNPTGSLEMCRGGDKVNFESMTGSIAPLDALRLVGRRMQVLGIEPTFIEGRKTISKISVLKRVEAKGTWGHLETADLSLKYGVAGSYDHCFVSILEKVANAAGDWNQWVIPFSVMEGFVEGWVVDVEYNHWQNAKDPLEYEAAGRDFSNLAMKSNGLPHPLEQMEIDISRNPGRWVLRPGYVEAIGSPMWLGKLFWERVGEDRRARVISASWLRVNQEADGVVVIQAADNCFASEDTASLQVRLRELLFG